MRLNRSLCSTPKNLEQEFNLEQDNYMDNLCEQYTKDGERIVAKMPLNMFRQCLANHFDIRFKRNDVTWPSRINKPK